MTSPPVTPTRTPSSRIAVQTLKSKAPSQLQQDQYSWSTTTTTRRVDGRVQNRPVQMDRMIGIASSAASLRNSVLTLRSQLDELRLLQTNHSRNFKIFLSQSVQDFNSLAAKVSCDLRTSKGLFIYISSIYSILFARINIIELANGTRTHFYLTINIMIYLALDRFVNLMNFHLQECYL